MQVANQHGMRPQRLNLGWALHRPTVMVGYGSGYWVLRVTHARCRLLCGGGGGGVQDMRAVHGMQVVQAATTTTSHVCF